MTAPILAAVDFSHPADAAARMAGEIAVRRGSRLVLVHVSPPPILAAVVVEPVFVPPTWLEAMRGRHQREVSARLAYLEERLRDEVAGLEVATHHHLGEPGPGIVAAASELGAGLVVMASHGGRAERFQVGSVAAVVAATAPCPVLLVGPEGPVEGRARAVFAALDPADAERVTALAAALLDSRGQAAASGPTPS